MNKLKWCKKILIALAVVILSPLIIVGVTIAGIYTLFQTPKEKRNIKNLVTMQISNKSSRWIF